MSGRRGTWLWALGLGWAAAFGLYMIWGNLTEAGLPLWLAEGEIDGNGHYEPMMIGTICWLLLGFLPMAPLISLTIRRQRLAPPSAIETWRQLGSVSRWCGAVGGLALLVSAAAFLLSLRLPDGSEGATPFDPALLRGQPPPLHLVQIGGRQDAASAATIVEDHHGRFSSARGETTYWTIFHPDGEAAAPGAPAGLFDERYMGDAAHGIAVQVGHLRLDGYLVEDGLPPLARHALERRGVRIAEPHYLLITRPGALREPYDAVAAAFLALAAIGFVFAGAMAYSRRVMARGGLR